MTTARVVRSTISQLSGLRCTGTVSLAIQRRQAECHTEQDSALHGNSLIVTVTTERIEWCVKKNGILVVPVQTPAREAAAQRVFSWRVRFSCSKSLNSFRALCGVLEGF